MSDDLVARLRHVWDERERQLDEDEQVALAAGGCTRPWWTWDQLKHYFIQADREHIARHDPARVLAEVERGRRDIAAKRRILDAGPDQHGYVKYGDWESCSDSCPELVQLEVIKLLAEAEGLADE